MRARYVFLGLYLCAVMSLSSCCEDDAYCESYSTGKLVVRVPIDEDNPELYKGRLIENKLIKRDTLYKDRKVYEKPSNRTYTVKAYINTGETLDAFAVQRYLEPNIDFCGCDQDGGLENFDFRPEE